MTGTDLERRRAQRDVEHLIAQLREILDLLDRGEIDLDHGCCMIHRLGGHLAAVALSGELVA